MQFMTVYIRCRLSSEWVIQIMKCSIRVGSQGSKGGKIAGAESQEQQGGLPAHENVTLY